MEIVSNPEKLQSIKSLESTIRKLETALVQMELKGSNTTLVRKRLKALQVGLALLENVWNQKPLIYTQEDFTEARSILFGLLPSLENIYLKLEADRPQKTLLERRIKALKITLQAIDEFSLE